MSSLRILIAIGLAAGFASTAMPASATTFASFTPSSGAANLRFVNNGSGAPDQASSGSGGRLYSTLTGAAQGPGLASVSFSFLSGPLAGLGPLSAWLQLDATTLVPGSIDGGTATQPGLTGFLRFTSRTPVIVGTTTHAAGTELLRADFTNAALVGPLGGTVATLTEGPGSISYRSDLIDFANSRDAGFSLSLSSVVAALHIAGAGTSRDPYRALRSFRAATAGATSADNGVAISAVPEPQSWAMLCAGFAMIGWQQRRRWRHPVVAG